RRTAMLVTPDRVLARRVCARLARWGVEADDSAGAPHSSTPLGAFLRLAAAAAIAPTPLSLLSLLTSKICDETGVCDLSPEETREGLRVLDLYAFRGPAGPPGLAGLRKKLTDWSAGDALKTEAARRGARLLGALETAFAPLADVTVQGRAPLRAWLSAHAAVAESLVGQGADLWESADGETAAEAMAGALSAADAGAETGDEDHSAVFHVSPPSYPAAFDQLIGAAVVRAGPPAHARLSILGPLEARLQSADRIILGALNEGVWPADVGADPWLSRPMRAAVGLPPPERRIGLAAHDFMQLASAPEVFLSRAARRGGAPAAPSRWMLRLETLLANEAQPGGLEVKRAPASALRATDATPRLRSWLAALDAPDGFAPAEPPHPRPPAAARPRSMSATAIETWVRDPYAIYAKRILRLRRLDAHEAPIGPAERGSALHEILAAWSRIDPGDPSAEQRMQDAAEQVLHGGAPPAIAALWVPRVVAMAHWYRRWAVERAPAWRPAIIEETGTLTLPRPGGDFTLTARADRIDAGAAGVSIIDFKTGDPPNLKQVSAGFSPQLPLEAAIAGAGGFEPLTERRIAELLYIKVGGRDGGRPAPIGAGDLGGPGGPVGEDAADLTDKALEGLKALIDQYDDADTPYRSQPRAQYVDDYGDYDHLARRKEWAGGGDAS
ncbi:MAG: double-strand break repair protein AddB, partial [Pseudomonadota bacterium]